MVTEISLMVTEVFPALYFGVILGMIGLGLFIGYHAYRGFRRHASGPMRFLSIGLILLTAIAPLIAFGNWQAVRMDLIGERVFWGVQLVYRLCQFSGLVLIAYSLYMRP